MMSVREHMALDIEARHWPRRAIGRKDAAIFELTGMTPVKHAAVVNMLIDRADVIAEMPQLCSRLRRLREARERVRRGADG